jgi:2-polyprenyl-3-methyl-5-hydroxy-6-metoxy-1,4-benzoquinol methylase
MCNDRIETNCMAAAQLNLNVDLNTFQEYERADDRISVILRYARNRSVLNVGCCGPDILSHTGPTLHRQIAGVSRTCCGIDVNEEGIRLMQDQGEDVLLADAESFDLEDKGFELVCAGDLIEHLENPGGFLARAHAHLADDGVLLLSTPNPFHLPQLVQLIARNTLHINNSEHICWYDPVLLSFLLERTHFRVEKTFWIDGNYWFFPYRWLMKQKPFLSRSFVTIATKA